MLLPIDNLHDRVVDNLTQIVKLSSERDRRLSEAETITKSMHQLQQIK